MFLIYPLLVYLPFVVTENQNINLLYVNDKENIIADAAASILLNYIKDNPDLNVSTQKYAEVKTSDNPQTSLESLCEAYTEMLNSGNPPDIVYDASKFGISAETIKTFVRLLGLPTVSGSFGQRGDIKQWRMLSDTEKKYLIQICPPSDLIAEILKSLILHQNISNAAVLYGKPMVMEHKVKTLFQSVAIRHEIERVQVNVKKQIADVHAKDITTFFVLGNGTTIAKVLEGAQEIGFFTTEFSWYVITPELNDLQCPACKKATILFLRPIIGTKYQNRNKVLIEKYNLKSERQISINFYFDLGLTAILAARDFKQNNAMNLTYLSCDDINGTNTPERELVDLMKYIKAESEEYPNKLMSGEIEDFERYIEESNESDEEHVID